jgi:hypothetical protein
MDPRTIKMLEERRGKDGAVPPPEIVRSQREQVMAWLQKHQRPVGIGVAALVVVSLVGRYALVTAPAARQEQIVQQAQAQAQQAGAQDDTLQKCLADAEATYTAEIEKACKAKKQGADCALPGLVADRIEAQRLDGRIACMRNFASK